MIRTISVSRDSSSQVYRVGLPLGQNEYLHFFGTSHPMTSANNLIAYRPRFQPRNPSLQSQLGVLFFNIDGIFPCVKSIQSYTPTCGLLTGDSNAFNQGRSFIQAADNGYNFPVFSSTENIKTYGIAVAGCPELTDACWPEYTSLTIFCLLPRQHCG